MSVAADFDKFDCTEFPLVYPYCGDQTAVTLADLLLSGDATDQITAECSPIAPVCSPTAPACRPTAPACRPTAPECSPTAPACRPTAPECSPTAPECSPTAPACRPTTPECSPTAPACNPTAASHAALAGPSSGQQQGPRPAATAATREELRRRKNRDMARQSRLRKKQQERQQLESAKRLRLSHRRLLEQSAKLERLYLDSLRYFGSQKNFLHYLRQNPGLVRDPDSKPLLRRFMSTGYNHLG